jgi:LAS superfamily LD-carboxypeptidase LdcB
MPSTVYHLEARAAQLAIVPAPNDYEPRLLHAAAAAFEAMRDAGLRDGVDLLVVSGFRSVERQTVIWSRKFLAALTDGLDHKEALARVFEWTAAPGWSRHHWGTDFDLIPAELAGDPRLESADWDEGGVAHGAHLWLAQHARDYGFARPYDVDHGGVKPEPWHWSYVPMALPRLLESDRVHWRPWFERRPFLGSEVIAADLPRLYARYVHGIAPGLIPTARAAAS